MDDDDFLWECALIDRDSNSTLFLVPGILDEPKHFLGSNALKESQEYSSRVPCRQEEKVDNLSLSISVVEIRGNGVLDTVGGEIWEASILLSAYILLNPEVFIQNSILELGSGLGLPGLLVAELQSLVYSPYKREVCLSDNDPRCVESLVQLIQRRYDGIEIEDSKVVPVEGDMKYSNDLLSVIDLDWSAYVPTSSTTDRSTTEDHQGSIIEASNSRSSSSSSSSSSSIDDTQDSNASLANYNDSQHDDVKDSNDLKPLLLSSERFQVLMGSALCYSPYHICLADTLKYFLDGACEEVVVIQISDRAGFSLLLDRLKYLKIKYTIEEVSQEIYDTAQFIGQSFSTSALSASSEPYESCLSDEGEVRIQKDFWFPTDLVQSAVRQCRAAAVKDSADQSGIDCHDNSPDLTISNRTESTIIVNRNLVKTDRESFKLLRVRK